MLSRSDKWFLGGGKGAIYAPPFPKHLVSPGFWDEAYFADIRLSKLFTVLFLEKSGKPIQIDSSKVIQWRPDYLIVEHSALGFQIRETRCVSANNAWISTFQLIGRTKPIDAFLWNLTDVREFGLGTPWTSATEAHVTANRISIRFETAWPVDLEPDRTAIEFETIRQSHQVMAPSLPVYLCLGMSGQIKSWTMNLTQRHDDSPLYQTSILPQKLKNGRLPEDHKFQVGTHPVDGLLHSVLQGELTHREPLVVACATALSEESAIDNLSLSLDGRALERSTQDWCDYFAQVPYFESSDAHLNHAYWYRWYGLRLNTVDIPNLPISGADQSFAPFVTEGIGFFRNFVSYSAQAHLREVSWMRDRRLADGIWTNLTRCQREDGSYPGHNYSARPSRDFYHSDFASPAIQCQLLTGNQVDPNLLRSLERWGEYYWGKRKCQFGIKIFDQNETGQEYMSRYQFASESADQWVQFEVVGMDATSYAFLLMHWLSKVSQDGALWEARATELRQNLSKAFQAEESFFCDRKVSGEFSWARPATGFYPLVATLDLLRDLDQSQLEALASRWLLNPNEFWLPSGFPATALSDLTFDADGEWKEKRLNCPWNGRSWPMANSHLVDALATLARTLDSEPLKEKAGEALSKVVRMMSHDGDPGRPNSYEHYDPITGVPALYRGYDDYMHSWIVDLILRYAVGIIPGDDRLDPLPMGLDWVECRNVPNRGMWMNIRLKQGEPPIIDWSS